MYLAKKGHKCGNILWSAGGKLSVDWFWVIAKNIRAARQLTRDAGFACHGPLTPHQAANILWNEQNIMILGALNRDAKKL